MFYHLTHRAWYLPVKSIGRVNCLVKTLCFVGRVPSGIRTYGPPSENQLEFEFDAFSHSATKAKDIGMLHHSLGGAVI